MAMRLILPLVADLMHIFLTGAAGLLGGDIAARLVAAGHSVIGLVRQAQDIISNDGQVVPALPFAGTMPDAGSMCLIKGDVSAAGLAIDPEQMEQFAAKIDLVIHCAAVTDFNASEDTYQRTNIGGVRNMLACFTRARFLHVSTAYVCGLKNGMISEAARDPVFGFANGYEQSKAAGEDLVRVIGKRAVIARPSIIIGAYDDGRMRSFDTFYKTFRMIAEGQITTLPVAAEATLDFVPFNHVAGGLMDIIAHWDQAAGKTFHLSSNGSIAVQNLADAIGGFAQLDQPKLVAPDNFLQASLPPLERRLYRHAAAFYSSYFQRSPLFETSNLAALSGRVCPAIDGAALHRMIAYCIEAGFIRAERQRISG
jgi:2-alkyl-3-oxoalkanoate reductase